MPYKNFRRHKLIFNFIGKFYQKSNQKMQHFACDSKKSNAGLASDKLVHSDALMLHEAVATSVHARIVGYFTQRSSCGMKSSGFLSVCPSELVALSRYFLNPRAMNSLLNSRCKSYFLFSMITIVGKKSKLFVSTSNFI